MASPSARQHRHVHDGALRSKLRSRLAAHERRTFDCGGDDGVVDAAVRPAAVAIALVAGVDGAACFLLTRRAATLRTHARQWALPGGRCDAGETATRTAQRELAEELGIDAGDEAVLGTLDDYPTRSGFVITPVVLWIEGTTAIRADPREVAACYRIPLDDLDRPDVPRFISIDESDRPVIQIPLLDTMIHAPTAAMLFQFAECVFRGRMTRVDHLEQPVFAWQ